MNLNQIHYFLAICEERNFTRAARKCDVSQPSLTTAIQRLEREFGGPLFVRSSPVRLTELGQALQPLFAQIGEAAGWAQRIAAEHSRLPRPQTCISEPARC